MNIFTRPLIRKKLNKEAAMDIKQQVLRILEENRGSTINGASLAKALNVTRSSIWKAVKALQNDGYHIKAVTNKGYTLHAGSDIISAESITPFLKGEASNFILEVHQTVTSTNTLAKERAAGGAREGTVIIAREQTKGRGRMGRTFYSPVSSGIYFSIILRPTLNLEDSLLITTAAAVAVSEAIEAVTGVTASIKWVNDIFSNGKKVCGILTEASLSFENGGLEYAVVGIGINIETKDFPAEIQQIAGSLYINKPENTPVSSILIANVLNNLAQRMNSLTDKHYLEEYKKRSFLIGRDILVIKGTKTLPAKAIDIDEKARLVVEYEGNIIEALNSGEVSVRPN
jgi:BirA family transcriptional regulator, biotin operon repressor / biotin---[acetyl-CoA-carboxylase] ligase